MQISLCWVTERQRCCNLSRTWFIVPVWWDTDVTQMNWLLTPRFLPGVVLYNTPHKWHVDTTSGSKKNLPFFFLSWDTIITGYSIPKIWNASDSFTKLVICWGFPSVHLKGFFFCFCFSCSQWGRDFIELSIALVGSQKCNTWLVWIVQIILSNMHCSTFISKCAVAFAGYF